MVAMQSLDWRADRWRLHSHFLINDVEEDMNGLDIFLSNANVGMGKSANIKLC